MVVNINRFKYFSLEDKFIILICLESAKKYSVFMTNDYEKNIYDLIKELKEDLIEK